MSKTLIATAVYNGDFFKDKEILSLDKSAQTNVKTTNQIQIPNIDFEAIYENKPIFYSAIGVALLLFILILKLIFKPKKKGQNKKAEQTKIANETPVFTEKKEQKIKLNYATPSNINTCIRMFLERTKHK